jgi:NADH-quinone oxidoreductase subunit E
VSVRFDKDGEERFQKILAEFTEGWSRVLPALHLAQEVFGAITPEVEVYMAERLDMPPARLREVLTFYHMYRKHPHGRYTLTICNNLSCELAGSRELLAHLGEKLGVAPGETTKDGLFTIEVAECIGACQLAPAFQVNGRFHGSLSLEEVDRLLEELAGQGPPRPPIGGGKK